MFKTLHCSKEYGDRRLGGTYKLMTKKGLYGEGVYKNTNCKLYIYKIQPTNYVISTRRGSRAIRAYSMSNDLDSRDGWTICQGLYNWVQPKM